MAKKEREKPHVGILESLLVVICILIILGYLIIFKSQSPQVPLLVSVIVLMLYGFIRGFGWDNVMSGIEEGIKPGVIPLVIFLMIGVLIATWIYSSTIPSSDCLYSLFISWVNLWKFIHNCLNNGDRLHGDRCCPQN